MALRVSPFVAGVIVSRASQAASMAASSWALSIGRLPFVTGLRWGVPIERGNPACNRRPRRGHGRRPAEADARRARRHRSGAGGSRQPASRSAAYRLAFADPDFLMREELRPVRLQLELLKPELLMQEYGVESTIVLFGGARIPEPAHRDRADGDARRPLAPLRRGAAARPDHDRTLHRLGPPAGRDRHGRRAGGDGGGQPRGGRGGRRVHRAEHRAAARAAAQRLRHAGPVLQLPLLRHPQDALPDAGAGRRGLPRRVRHARRAVRDADAGADGADAAPAHRAVRRGLLASGS
jgi:hypothetical protein